MTPSPKTVELLELIEVQRQRSEAVQHHHAEQNWITGQLLKGGLTLFGKPVRIEWPEGPPEGLDLAEMAEVCLRHGHTITEHAPSPKK